MGISSSLEDPRYNYRQPVKVELGVKTHLRPQEELLILEDVNPVFVYSFAEQSHFVHRIRLSTGEQSTHQLISLAFRHGCCLSEVYGGSLLVTGGGGVLGTTSVERIDVMREFAVYEQAPMLVPRLLHSAVSHAQHLYVLGAYNTYRLKECERYVCTQNRWESIPPLPKACGLASGVVVKGSLYALGGIGWINSLDLIQKLNLQELTWELLEVRLPSPGYGLPCFKTKDSQICFVVEGGLYSISPQTVQVQLMSTVSADIKSYVGPSYYSRGTLYCSNFGGETAYIEIGRKTN
jgi:hypothetical protein